MAPYLLRGDFRRVFVIRPPLDCGEVLPGRCPHPTEADPDTPRDLTEARTRESCAILKFSRCCARGTRCLSRRPPWFQTLPPMHSDAMLRRFATCSFRLRNPGIAVSLRRTRFRSPGTRWDLAPSGGIGDVKLLKEKALDVNMWVKGDVVCKLF